MLSKMIHQWQRLLFICVNTLLNLAIGTRLQSQCAALNNNVNITAHYYDSSCYVLTNGKEVVNTTFGEALSQCNQFSGGGFCQMFFFVFDAKFSFRRSSSMAFYDDTT